MSLLNYELEEAMVSLVMSVLGPEASVFPGRSPKDKVLPCWICEADGESIEEDPKGTGNFWVNAAVYSKSSAATEPDGTDPTLLNVSLASDLFGAFMQSDLPTQLNSQGRNLTVFPNGVIFMSPQSGRDAEGVWIDGLPMRIYCCASVLAP